MGRYQVCKNISFFLTNQINYFYFRSEENIVKGNTITKISLNLLIGLVTCVGTPDVRLQYIFLRNYPSFVTDEKLFQKLKERFYVPNNSSPQFVNAVRRGVLQFISQWISSEVNYIDRSVLQEIYELLKSVNHPMNAPTEKLIEETLKFTVVTFKPSPEITPWNDCDKFLKTDDEIIARQLTLIDYQIYRSICGRELIQAAWSSPKYRYRAVHVRRLIDRQNQLSFWITTLIVLGRTIKERVEIWEKWIRIAVVIIF